jgi:hypothetical protein
LHLPSESSYSPALLAIPRPWKVGICRDLGFEHSVG